MRVRSLGLHTDLALHGWRGRVRDRHDHLVVTHPDVPAFRGGNLLVFERPPEASDLERWCDLFDRAIGVPPAFPYRAFAWDGLDGEEGELAPFLVAGFAPEPGVVLAAPRLTPPEHPNREVRLLALDDDAGWAAALDVQARASGRVGEGWYRRLLRGVLGANRRVVEAGHGVWWGAFEGDAQVANLGIFRVGEVARIEAVVTDPARQRRGIASTLLHHATEQARRLWGSELVLLEAEPDGPATGVYERLGLRSIEWRVGLGQARRPAA